MGRRLDSVVKRLKENPESTRREVLARSIFLVRAAQELASQDEKLLLMESSFKATQEQLTEQIAETVRQEQNSRKPQAEPKTVTEGIIASEEEKNDYK
ncbi:hypothetical protein AB1E18_010531 [Capra hircus]